MTYHGCIGQWYRCCDASTNSLDGETDGVTTHEEDGICSGPESANLFAVHNHNPAQAQIYGGCNEGWSDRQVDKVHQEVDSAEGIEM